MKRAALYLRSSKDRSDVSIDAQRRALKELAQTRGLEVAAEFADAVESGKDDDRPGFQRLIGAVRDSARGWDTLLVYDTSRLARRRVITILFEEVDCRRNGVQVVYKSLPDADPITEMMLKSVLQAMDEYHSLISKQKGMAGMAENVRQGYRAGGRAPRGYRLRKVHTGAVRDGEPVAKSVLELDPDEAPKVAAYLAARASGTPARTAARAAGLEAPSTSLISLEWNALTYAGHTVWGVHAERQGGHYLGGSKRRPRSEWVVKRDTHPALISEETAEAILARLTASGARRRATRDTSASLLSGLLFCPQGGKWWAQGDSYRLKRAGKARSVQAEILEDAVARQVFEDLRSPRLLSRLVESVKRTIEGARDDDRVAGLEAELAAIEARISRQMDLAADMRNPAPALRKISELEGRRAELAQDVAAAQAEKAQALAAASITEADVRRTLDGLLAELRSDDRKDLRELLVTLVDRIVLDPISLDAELHYRVQPTTGVKLASPRGFEPRSQP